MDQTHFLHNDWINTMNDMSGKVAVVTGGAAGIGRAIAENFSRLGATVVVGDVSTDTSVAQTITSRGGECVFLPCDVSDPESVGAFARSICERHDGRIDVLVNNAGTNGECHLVEKMPLDVWERTFRINVTGMMLVTKAFIPQLRASGSGAIVNIASNTGRRGVQWRSDYACSKWAVIGFTQTLAIELASSGIRANTVNPGPVAGDRIDQILEMHAAAEGRTVQAIKEEWLQAVPLKRFVEPQEVADTVAYLASTQSGALTGQALEVSCGLVMS
jgi:NAD(P)-dependent dehydrogenase (short-subunit alcohol dehydrogenase family)